MAGAEEARVYSATYSNVPVYEFKVNGESIMRRRADNWINATHILKIAGFDKPARTRILEREVQKGVHEKVQGGYGKYQGTWIPLHEGRVLAERNNVIDVLRPILDYVAGDRSPPPAPKHTTSAASRAKGTKNGAASRRSTAAAAASGDMFNQVQPARNMAPPTFHHEQYDMHPGFDEDDAIEQATLESSSMVADEEMMPMSQHSAYSRKRKRGINEVAAMSIVEQEHILYGDQLLDYFMTVGDAPEATRIPPPAPPAHFQVDRAIDDSGNTALHWACAMGDLEIVQDLLRRGADVKALSIHDETPLVRAVLFTNNYEKRTFPALLDFLLDTVSFRDWFGATIFHHIAETTRSKGKWKSSRYYSEILLEKLRNTCSQDEVALLLSCQDQHGDTAALVAARNAAFRLVDILLMHCPRAGDLVNKKGETANSMVRQSQNVDREIPPPPSSITMGNDHMEGDVVPPVNNPDHNSVALAAESSSVTSTLLSQIGTIMAEANKKLAQHYGSTKVNQQDSDDVANPEALYEQLEVDRQKIQAQTASFSVKEATGEPIDVQLRRYGKIKSTYESLLEQVQRARLFERGALGPSPVAEDSKVTPPDQAELGRLYHLARQLSSAQKTRHAALRDFVQQTADAGASTKLDVHRKLVSLATGLREEELDPMSAELADTLEFDRMNGKSSGAESPEPEGARQLPSKEPVSRPLPGPAVSVDV